METRSMFLRCLTVVFFSLSFFGLQPFEKCVRSQEGYGISGTRFSDGMSTQFKMVRHAAGITALHLKFFPKEETRNTNEVVLLFLGGYKLDEIEQEKNDTICFSCESSGRVILVKCMISDSRRRQKVCIDGLNIEFGRSQIAKVQFSDDRFVVSTAPLPLCVGSTLLDLASSSKSIQECIEGVSWEEGINVEALFTNKN
jgi:hypothetical protein